MRSLLLFLCLRGLVFAEALPYTVPPRPPDADRPTLVEDHPNLLFRTAAQLAAAYKGDSTGLADLKMSGSSEFNSVSLAEILQGLPTRQVTIVDLRQESHVLINDRLVTWEAGEDWSVWWTPSNMTTGSVRQVKPPRWRRCAVRSSWCVRLDWITSA